jgi:hypothetical protein
MPIKAAIDRAHRDLRQGKKPSTQAGEFVKEEMRRFHAGKGTIRSARQAVAVGLSEARRAGVKLSAPKGDGAMRRKAKRDLDIGKGRAHPSPSRSRGAKMAARTRARRMAA